MLRVRHNHTVFWHLILANSPEKDPEPFGVKWQQREESSSLRGDTEIDAPWRLIGLEKKASGLN